jgi:SAM-dependent methyltransferase
MTGLCCVLKSYKDAVHTTRFGVHFQGTPFQYSYIHKIRHVSFYGGRVWEESNTDALYALFQKFKQPAATTYLSLGSGIGTDCFVAAACGFTKIVGYELEPTLIDLAATLAAKMEKQLGSALPITFIQGDFLNAPVEEFDFTYAYSDNNVSFDRKVSGTFDQRWKPGSRLLFNSLRSDYEAEDRIFEEKLVLKQTYRVQKWLTYHLQLFEF